MSDDSPRERFFKGLANEGGPGELTGETPRERFFEGLDKDVRSRCVARDNVCPPTPQSTKVAAESRNNYSTLSNASNAQNYGMTGLMAVNSFEAACYGQIRPGYVILFPGTYETSPPAYNGTVSLNCAAHAALLPGGGALHAQMCSILNQPSTNFIGFSFWYPFNGAGNMGYSSGTCNPYWFGTNTVSTNCNGVNWQQIIYNALLEWLPH
jgi:hypothetical protein